MSRQNPLYPSHSLVHAEAMQTVEVNDLLKVAVALGLPPRAAYPVRQAARIAGLGRNLLYELVHSGQVRSVRVGRTLYVPVSELARLLSGPQSDAGAPRPGEKGA